MARHSDPQNTADRTAATAVDHASATPVDRFLELGAVDPPARPAQGDAATRGPIDRVLASTPSAPRAVDRRADARLAMLGGRSAGTADLVVREALENDAPALARLAEVDGGRVPATPILLAERAGVPVAAIGVLDRRVLADPAADDHAAIDRLQAVAAEQRGPERRRRWATRLRRDARGGTAVGGMHGGTPRAAR